MVFVKDTGGDCPFLTDSVSLPPQSDSSEGGQELHSNGCE